MKKFSAIQNIVMVGQRSGSNIKKSIASLVNNKLLHLLSLIIYAELFKIGLRKLKN